MPTHIERAVALGPIERSKASLRVVGADLDPDEISRLLGCLPTRTRASAASAGSGAAPASAPNLWILRAEAASPENLDGQIKALLDRLTQDLSVWTQLAERFELELFCGLFMSHDNQGLGLSVTSLEALACRRIRLGMDIYAP